MRGVPMDSSQAVQKSRATIKSYRRTLAKRAAREVTFSDLSESELAQLFTTDEYESDYYRFQVSGFDVLVKNELLAEALNALPERKRDIVLLSYFLDMSDAEIGELLNVVRRRFSGTGKGMPDSRAFGGASSTGAAR